MPGTGRASVTHTEQQRTGMQRQSPVPLASCPGCSCPAAEVLLRPRASANTAPTGLLPLFRGPLSHAKTRKAPWQCVSGCCVPRIPHAAPGPTLKPHCVSRTLPPATKYTSAWKPRVRKLRSGERLVTASLCRCARLPYATPSGPWAASAGLGEERPKAAGGGEQVGIMSLGC